MSFTFQGNPTLRLTYSTPNLREGDLGIQTAKWEGDATVKVKDEHGKKWRVGFAQLLEMNTMQAVYEKHTRSEVLIGNATMPILDSDGTVNYRPFYDDSTANGDKRPHDVETSIGVPEKLARVKMWDEPESDYPWWFNHDETDPLIEFIMNLKFSTYIVARDITGGSSDNGPYVMKILKQWSVMLDRRYEFTVVKKTGGGPLKADLTKSGCKVINPSRQPMVMGSTRGFPKNSAAIMAGSVANDVFADDDKLTGKRHVGSLVKSRAAMWGGTV
jgi:hypothetical protein